MANSKKSKKSQPAAKGKLAVEKEERVTMRQVVKDERTHKITGAVFLLLSVFLLIAFTSYLFTWKNDFASVSNGISMLWHSSNEKTANLLGNLGAYVSHQFIYNGFGIASYFFCSFFFIVGVNLLFKKKVFSVGRNLRYVLAGLLFFSVALAFIFKGNSFPWGGEVGNIVSNWLIHAIGWIGTAALLLVAGLAYIIWRFNPVFKVPVIPKKEKLVQPEEVIAGDDNAKLFVEENVANEKGNKLKGESRITVIPPKNNFDTNPSTDLKLIEKDIDEKKEAAKKDEPVVKEELPIEESMETILQEPAKMVKPVEKTIPIKNKTSDLELEIKTNLPEVDEHDDKAEVENDNEDATELERKSTDQPDYEPTLDLRDYKYPSLELLEAHGSEKIVQDANELEANKNQIIGTLKNYDIEIQKISATVGPTVTLYEIVPAAGVRISRIKNLEDDIALSLAALGIRIIAPIPGKGTIGIEVPNVKKTVVSMRTLLASEKFQYNNFNLPIAIGKKIDNENFIVDLSAMPHLLMAGATGQGKSVGLNAILVSLLYKKHPSQLKLVLVDPKKVELSLYRTIEK
ncbi:MAG: DNA translocase FtsK, partial [Bacteroidetes bacterium]|nr:DNA translocase FtsK [Bacteroidota bacterium]